MFNVEVDYEKIRSSKFRDNFTNITYYARYLKFPKKSDGNIVMIKKLYFGILFDEPLNKNSIPESVTKLIFGAKFNQVLNENSIPKSVSNLEDCILLFSGRKMRPLWVTLPQNTHLTFGNFFNQPLNRISIPKFSYPFNLRDSFQPTIK